jgi:nitrous oxide reductase accessory protein NosL
MKVWGVLALAAGVALAGCQSDEDSFYNAPKPLDKMSPDEVCTFYQHYLSNPSLSASNRAITVEQLKAKHCPVPS